MPKLKHPQSTLKKHNHAQLRLDGGEPYVHVHNFKYSDDGVTVREMCDCGLILKYERKDENFRYT